MNPTCLRWLNPSFFNIDVSRILIFTFNSLIVQWKNHNNPTVPKPGNMKFGKEFTSQMVPEWQEAYMDYVFLKTRLKEIHGFKQRARPPATPGGLKRKLTLYRAFSGLIHRHNHPTSPSSPDIEEQPILVNSVDRNGSRSYETTFLMQADDGAEYELVFFRRLDDEFNKVNKFYKSKVEEVTKEAEILNKQMDALIAFRIKVENPQGWSWEDRSGEITRLASDVAASTAALAASTPAGARASSKHKTYMFST